MPVPTARTDLSTTIASNSPAGGDAVFPNLDNYLRAAFGFIAQNYEDIGDLFPQSYEKTVTGSDTEGGKFAENITVTNPTTLAGYGARYAFYHHTGDMGSSGYDIGEASIGRWESISSGITFGNWLVTTSPLAVGSGYTGAPTVTQSFGIVGREVNPQNRNSAGVWANETRLFTKWVVGEQMVAETQDFSATLGNVRVGYNVHAGYVISRSGYTSNVTNRHAMFFNGTLIHPNTIAPTGYGAFYAGFRTFLIAAAISNAGTGYTVGDILTFASGLSASLNKEAAVKVLTVSSGVITSVELYDSGGYTSTFASPVSVTGGTGTGATFTYTYATPASEYPRAALGVSGAWLYGIDMCPDPDPKIYANCINAAIRIPNNQLIVAYNAASNSDVSVVKVNTSNQVELAGQAIIARTTWTPTFTAGAGTLTTISATSAKFSKINGIVQGQISILLTTKGIATTSLRFTVPAAVAGTEGFAASGVDATTGAALACICTPGGTYIECKKYDGTDPLTDGDTYVITFSYAAA